MNTELTNAVLATDKDAQYDNCVKRLLGNKKILAHILSKVVDEFKGMKPSIVESYIEGKPIISKVPIEPGLTNAKREEQGQKTVVLNTENSEINEGLVRFDIIVNVWMKDGLSQIIINVEAQKDAPTAYDILNRAIFYVSRLISSQKERDFINSNYNDIKRVFSIWVCMNMKQNSLNYVHLTNDSILGSYKWKGNLDLFNIVLIGVAKKLQEHEENYELHRLLGALLSDKLSVNEKLSIMETEYDIPIENDIREDVNSMCNLSQGIREEAKADGIAIGRKDGIAIGRKDGIAIGKSNTEVRFIMNMHKKGQTLAEIAEITEKSMEDVKAIITKESKTPL